MTNRNAVYNLPIFQRLNHQLAFYIFNKLLPTSDLKCTFSVIYHVILKLSRGDVRPV